MHIVIGQVPVHLYFLDYNRALLFHIIFAYPGMQYHIGKYLQRFAYIAAAYLGKITCQFFGSKTVQRTASAFDFFLYLTAIFCGGSFKKHVLQKMRRPAKPFTFVPRACGNPYSYCRRFHTRHIIQYYPKPIIQFYLSIHGSPDTPVRLAAPLSYQLRIYVFSEKYPRLKERVRLEKK